MAEKGSRVERVGGEADERSGGSLPLEIGVSQSASGTGFKKVFLGLRNPMLRPVELLRGGMKFGDAKFSYVIAGMGMRMRMATWRQRSFHTQQKKKQKQTTSRSGRT